MRAYFSLLSPKEQPTITSFPIKIKTNFFGGDITRRQQVMFNLANYPGEHASDPLAGRWPSAAVCPDLAPVRPTSPLGLADVLWRSPHRPRWTQRTLYMLCLGYPGSNFDQDGELWHRSRQIWSTKAPTKAQALLIVLAARYISVARFCLLSLFLLLYMLARLPLLSCFPGMSLPCLWAPNL